MTFSPETYRYWSKEYPMFMQFALDKGILFQPTILDEDSDERYDLMSKCYLLMKRLGQDYKTILKMNSEERDTFFKMELECMKEQEKALKDNQNQIT